MGVRPPTGDANTTPETVTFGIAALDERLTDARITYPADADEIVAALGDPAVPYDVSGNTVALSDALAETHFDRFETEQELLNALHPVFEAYRERGGDGLLGHLRAMLPF